VNGKPAKVYGIRQPNGTDGISIDVTKPYRVRVVNALGTDSLIHWHGLTPPYKQDGVPGVSGPPIPGGGIADYNFPLRVAGTFRMHSHVGFQEQRLLAAPLIIHDRAERRNKREIVVMLADFSFTPPEEIFAGLRKAPMAPMGPAAAPDLNDVKYDAFLANDRTLADRDVVKVDPGGSVRLRSQQRSRTVLE
jgi:FtsP/CotA-like multicopper oxidase with cupredoxin domain